MVQKGLNKEEIGWIQGLRGVACILVVLTHARYFMLDTPMWPLANQLLMPGAMGVDLFFVISGFIMVVTTTGARANGGAGAFLVKRFTRIWPPYALMTVAWVVLFGGGFAAFGSAASLKEILASLAFLPVNPRIPLYFSTTLPLGWTLEFEAYFYFVFAVSMLFRRLRWVALFGWLAYSVIVFPMARRGLNLDAQLDLGYRFGYASLMTSPMVLEFVAGAAAAALYLSPLRIESVRLCWNLLFLSIAVALWSVYAHFDFHGPLKWGTAAFVIVAACALAGKTVEIVVPQTLMWLGTISYSLYLTHTTAQQLLQGWFVRHGLDTRNWGFVFLTTCTAIVVAWVFHELVEVRLCRRFRQMAEFLLSALRRRSSRSIRSTIRERELDAADPAGDAVVDPGAQEGEDEAENGVENRHQPEHAPLDRLVREQHRQGHHQHQRNRDDQVQRGHHF
jgi:peptidoglycan/LPS O-acetylase OafA/YrhL